MRERESMGDVVLSCIGAICLVLILGLIGAIIGCWLWGVIAVGIFGFPALGFWQFYGMMILIRIILPTSSVRGNRK